MQEFQKYVKVDGYNNINFSNHKLPIVIIAFIILGSVGLLLAKNNIIEPSKTVLPAKTASDAAKAKKNIVKVITPTKTPVTLQNVDKELGAIDNDIQTILEQINLDLTKIDQINPAQDSTTGM